MNIYNEELKEIIDLWNLKPEVKKKIFNLLDENPSIKPAHLFRYYCPDEKQNKVGKLEKMFTQKFNSKYALAVNSGTSSLLAALVACDIGPGDEVIVPGYTFFASASVVVVAKAIPVIAEIDETLTLDVKDVEKKITPQTKAIIPVHMRGLPSNMDGIMKIAKKYKLKIIEDVAQAAGGKYKDKYLGTFGDAGCFSLDAYKIIATGEGGMLLTDDEKTYIKAQSWHDTAACWRPNRYEKERMQGELFCGENYRLSQVQGAIGIAQMKKLNKYITKLRKNKKILMESLEGKLKTQTLAPINDIEGDCSTNLILLSKTSEKTKEKLETLKKKGVPAGGIYDQTVRDWHIYKFWEHILQKKTPTEEGCPFTCPYYKGELPDYNQNMCPQTLSILERVISISINENWTRQDIKKIAETIIENQ
ncbi:DegT/DnrJ/EryC1/StrS family aminotransferase [bacterium]|nr:DegT/DnrJ/EryC1/StrS family aminotransferase [bacterium]